MKIAVKLPYVEAQAVVDMPRKWRRAYQPDEHKLAAIEIMRAAAAAARRRQAEVQVTLSLTEARALIDMRRVLPRGSQLTPNQSAALAKIQFAIKQSQQSKGESL